MPQLIFALATIAGAWVAWRHNPLYKTWTTVRFIGIVGLAIAGLIGLLVAVVNWTEGRSEAVTFGVLMATVLVGTLGMIFLIISLTTPKSTALPPTARLVDTHRRRLHGWTKRLAIFVVAMGALGFARPNDLGIVVWTIGGFAAFLGVIVLCAGYWAARDLDHLLTALETNPWVHWTYSAAEWQAWVGAELAQIQTPPLFPNFHSKREWPVVLLVAALVAVGAWGGAQDASWQLKAGVTVGIWTVMGLTFWGIVALNRGAANRKRKDLLGAASEAYIGYDGLFCDGAFNPWLTASQYLTEAWVEQQAPRRLSFRFNKVMTGGYGPSTVPFDQHVPIPSGGDGDLARLQQELVARCPRAQIALA